MGRGVGTGEGSSAAVGLDPPLLQVWTGPPRPTWAGRGSLSPSDGYFFRVCCRRAWSLCRAPLGLDPEPMEKAGAGEPPNGEGAKPGLPKGTGAAVLWPKAGVDVPKVGLLSVALLAPPKEKFWVRPEGWAGAGVPNVPPATAAPKLKPPEAGCRGVAWEGAGALGCAVAALPKEKVGAAAGRGAEVWVLEPKVGAVEGAVVVPNANPDVPPPNAGWLGVPKDGGADVVAAPPKLKGVAPAPPPLDPKAKGLAATAWGAEGKAAGPSKAGFPKENPGWPAGAGPVAVEVAVLNPPKGPVEAWVLGVPKLKPAWVAGGAAVVAVAAPN